MAKEAPTILQIIPRLDTGGAELSTLEIAEAILAAHGNAIVVTEGGRMVPRLKEMGAKVLFAAVGSKNPVIMAKNIITFSRIIKTYDVDLLHARSRAPAWSALCAARLHSRCFVTTYHGAYKEDNSLKSFYNSIMARGDLVIANSSYTCGLIKSRYGLKSSKMRNIPRGIDTQKFNPSQITPSQVAELRKKWNLSGKDRIIFHPARLTSWKGHSIVLEAARLLKEQNLIENIKIVMAGDDQGRDDYKKCLQEKIYTWGLQNIVQLVGHVDDMTTAFRSADVTVIASTQPEAFGRTAIEAQAMKCPIIATRLGGVMETVRSTPEFPPEMRTGWLIPPEDPKALSKALIEALDLSPSAREAMGKRGQLHVSLAFSLSQMRLKTLRVYDELLGTSFEEKYEALQPQIDG